MPPALRFSLHPAPRPHHPRRDRQRRRRATQHRRRQPAFAAQSQSTAYEQRKVSAVRWTNQTASTTPWLCRSAPMCAASPGYRCGEAVRRPPLGDAAADRRERAAPSRRRRGAPGDEARGAVDVPPIRGMSRYSARHAGREGAPPGSPRYLPSEGREFDGAMNDTSLTTLSGSPEGPFSMHQSVTAAYGCPTCRPTLASPTWSRWPRSAGASSTTSANSSGRAWTTSKADPGRVAHHVTS